MNDKNEIWELFVDLFHSYHLVFTTLEKKLTGDRNGVSKIEANLII